jgi:signal transduction histidine kinase
LIGIAIVALGFFIVRYYYKTRLRKQRIEYEKILAVQAERQRISSEIHDDIGAGLSAIRLLTEITKDKLPESDAQREVGKIHASISELSQKMREVIWSLNTDNDHLKNLLYYIQRQANLLFENSSIRLKVFFPTQEIPDVVIKGEKRRHIYLSVKEALHNCLKHSHADTCHLSMRVEDRILQITISDDGKGFAPIDKWQTGNGLTGMRRRMQQINGYFEVQSKEKTEVRFIIPLNEKS